MHVRNLFLSLDASKSVPENFCTEGLAWILETDHAARRTFLEACAARVVAGSANREAANALHRLAENESVSVSTRRWVRPSPAGPYCSPDLSITDNAGYCCLIEVKQWAKPSRNTSFVASDATTRSEIGLATNASEPRYRVQTLAYRQWLDASHKGRGALVALMVRANEELGGHCHGTLTWTELAEAMRGADIVTPTTSAFVRFLEAKHMATPSITAISSADSATLRAAAECNWAGWMSLLDEISSEMSRLLASSGEKIATRIDRIEGSWNLQVWPESREQGFWLGHTKLSGVGQAKYAIEPWLLCDRETIELVVNVVSPQLRGVEIPALRDQMPDVARIEKGSEDRDETLCYLTPLDQALLSHAALRDQAAALAEMALTKIVRPLLPLL